MTADEAQRTTLEKVRVLQRKLYRAAKAQPQRTFGVLFDKVCSLEVLWVAWEQVRRNRAAAGVDGKTIESIEAKGTLWFLWPPATSWIIRIPEFAIALAGFAAGVRACRRAGRLPRSWR